MRTVEALGYAHLVPPDHLLGVNPSADHSGRRVGTTANACHDPFVLFGFLSGCTQQNSCRVVGSSSGSASAGTRSSSSASTRTCATAASARRRR